MTLETFFEKFDQFADAPYAVAKMRELVLHLAVTGKLVPQDPNEGDAREMIDRAMIKRQQTIKTKNLRRKDLDESADLFEHEDLPSSWCVERFANLVDPENTISYGVLVPGNDVPDGIPFVRAQDLCLSNHPDRPNKTIAPEIEKPYTRTRLTGGEILLCVVGSIGKLGIVPDSWAGANIARAVARIKPIPDVLRDYLLLVLQDKSVQNYFISTTRTLAQPTLNVGMIEQTPIPVPPLAEQKRIVAKVDELMALCDRLEAQQQERERRHAALARASLARFADAPTPANLSYLFHSSFIIHPSSLRRSILTLAVQGKLVPQDPNDEPAIENLDEIESEKAFLIEARKLRPNRVTEISQTKGLQYEVPDSWRWFRLGDVAFFQEGPGIRNWQFRTEGIKLLNVQNIVDGKLVLENTDRHISTEEFESTYRHFAVETGDILFASSGASWGKTAWFVDPGYTVMLNTSMVRMKFYSKRCDDAFLLLFLRTDFFKTQMEIQLVGIQPNFGSTHLGRVYIPLPPLAEQRRIVAKVEQLMALVDALETQLAASRATAANLLSALVAELTQPS